MNAHFQAHQIVRLIEFGSTELHITLSARPLHARLKLAIQQ
jgi:hypothetical protein